MPQSRLGVDAPRGGTDWSASAQEIKTQLEKILASRVFRTAERQRDFLRYAVERRLEGSADRIKEYCIGTEVFHRGDAFDPRLDPIVRIEARKLRQRLAKYYAAEGEHDAVRIEFPKGGYTPVFQQVPVPEAEPAGPMAGDPAPKRSLNWNVLVAALAVLILAAAAAGYWLGAGLRASTVSSHATAIAVLPFLNLGESREDDYFSDGLTEELIDSLGRVPGLQVVARTSSYQFRGKTVDVREIGRKLNARTVLEGSVRKYGGRLRIMAQLADASNGYRLWSDSYDRDTKDALAIQREISQAIVRALTGRLGETSGASPASASIDGPVAVSPEAHEAYLKGLYFWSKNTPDGNWTAQKYLEEAIAKEPGYARAYTALARCYIIRPYLTEVPPSAVVPKIEAAAQKALQLDGSLAEAHVDRAVAAAWAYDWPGSEREFRKALELDPDSAVAHRLYNENYLVKVGRLEESLREVRTALKLEPVSVYLTQTVGRSLYYLHRYDEALEQFRKAQALDPDYGTTNRGLGLLYIQQGRYADGVAELEIATRRMKGDPWIGGLLGYAYGVSGNRAAARRILDGFLEQSKRGPLPSVVIAQIYIGLGDKDRAFAWLRKSVDQGDAHVLLLAEPLYDSLRGDPRFTDLLKRMKLPMSSAAKPDS